MTRAEKINLLKQLQSGKVSRFDLLNANEYHLIGYDTRDDEQHLEAWVNELGFAFIDKQKKQLWFPRYMTEEQEAKMWPNGKLTTDELLEYLDRKNKRQKNLHDDLP